MKARTPAGASTRAAAVVDPQRDIDQYLGFAAAHGLTITHVFLTHFHADFVAGHLELRDRAGATICLGASARADYPFTALKNGDVVSLVRERGVALEMCPTSNRRTHAVADLADHPARRLLDQDVSVTINTDNPGLFAIDLTNELRVCVDVLGFSDDDLRRVTANALDASFVGRAAKADVRERHFGWVDA